MDVKAQVVADMERWSWLGLFARETKVAGFSFLVSRIVSRENVGKTWLWAGGAQESVKTWKVLTRSPGDINKSFASVLGALYCRVLGGA